MAEVSLGPLLKASDVVRFSDSHRPVLPDGRYRFKVSHHLAVGGVEALAGHRSLDILVAGPRVALAPGDIASSFPPPGADGDFARVLPHVLLQRASLPWERTPGSDRPLNAPPWLALLVLADDEFTPSTVPASSLGVTPPAGAPAFEPLLAEPGDDPAQPVSVIDLDVALADALLPTWADLPWLAGVREVNDADARALLVANRAPVAGRRNVVHLVSLEGRYEPVPQPAPGQPDHRLRAAPAGSTRVRLVSLAQWAFHCAPAQAGVDLATHLTSLRFGTLLLDTAGLAAALGPVRAGAVPLEHRLADGGRSAAWYHGPLMVQSNGARLPLPARRAEELLLLESATGMVDLSYAAAWTLGRLLALRDPAVGVKLHQWKRQLAHAGPPSTTPPGGPPTAPAVPVPDGLATWFDHALARLAAVPFAYLLPEPALLPPENLVAFTLDPVWLAALFDGAFSVGRTSERERVADAALAAGLLPATGGRSGVLVRSAAVAGWPDLVVSGRDAQGVPLDTLRYDRLAPDTLLVLFKGLVRQVTLHPHPQALHFGTDGAAATPLAPGGAWRDATRGVIDVDALATALSTRAPHEFALAMLAHTPRATYQVVVPHG